MVINKIKKSPFWFSKSLNKHKPVLTYAIKIVQFQNFEITWNENILRISSSFSNKVGNSNCISLYVSQFLLHFILIFNVTKIFQINVIYKYGNDLFHLCTWIYLTTFKNFNKRIFKFLILHAITTLRKLEIENLLNNKVCIR